nr:dihydroneopterin aldolase [uncultured Allomuricauda sp.]
MGKIQVNNIRVHSNHGCLKEEMLIGSDYRVDLEVHADLSIPAESDKLGDTVDYVHLNNIVKEEMAVRSNLLEHVAKRILNRIFFEIAPVSEAEIKVAKINPPIGGDVESVTVILQDTRDK